MKSIMLLFGCIFACIVVAQDEVPIEDDCHCAGSVKTFQRPWDAGWPDCMEFYQYHVDVKEHGTCAIQGSEVCTEELKCKFFGWFESFGDDCDYEILIEGLPFDDHQGDYWYTNWNSALWCGWTDYPPIEIYIDGFLMVIIQMTCEDCPYYTSDADQVPTGKTNYREDGATGYQRPWYITVFNEEYDLSRWKQTVYKGGQSRQPILTNRR